MLTWARLCRRTLRRIALPGLCGALLGMLAALPALAQAPAAPQPEVPAGQGAAPPRERFRVAVLELEPELGDAASSQKITEALRERLRKTGRYTVLAAEVMHERLAQAPPHIAVCTAVECALEAGQLLGVKLVIAGRVTRMSSRRWEISVIQVDVETGETITSDHDLHKGRPDSATDTLGPIVEELTVTASPDGREFRQAQRDWRWKMGAMLGTASLLTLGGAYMYTEVQRSNQRQANLRIQADQALTMTQFNEFKSRLAAETDRGKQLRFEAINVQAAAVLFMYLTYYVGSRPPQLSEVPISAEPEAVPGGARVSLSYRW
jgi:exosome complex RNA-binding protein Csl4